MRKWYCLFDVLLVICNVGSRKFFLFVLFVACIMLYIDTCDDNILYHIFIPSKIISFDLNTTLLMYIVYVISIICVNFRLAITKLFRYFKFNISSVVRIWFPFMLGSQMCYIRYKNFFIGIFLCSSCVHRFSGFQLLSFYAFWLFRF